MDIPMNPPDPGSFDNFDDAIKWLGDEIPQHVLNDFMSDMNLFGGIEVNSLSSSPSEDSGRSSSPCDDVIMKMYAPNETDMYPYSDYVHYNDKSGFKCPSPSNSPPEIKQENLIHPTTPITIPSSSLSPPTATHTNPICVPQPISFSSAQQTISTPMMIPQPKIVLKQEQTPLAPAQQILTIRNIGGNFFMTDSAAATVNQTPIHTIVNGTPGILTKIPIMPVTRIMTEPTTTTPKPPVPSLSSVIERKSMANTKKSGHNIIERRYRTSIVSIITTTRLYSAIVFNFFSFSFRQ